YVVTVTSIPTDPLSQGAPETQSITIHVGLTRASEVTITMIDPVPGAVEIGSVKRVWPCAAAISHPRYAHLVQWNASDVAPRSGFGLAFAPTFLAPGRHELRVGPNRRQAATFDIYAVSSVLVHSALGDAVDYGTPVTFTAITNPPGYAKYVGWRIDTAQDMHSHAEPVVGSGETFSATFTPSGGAALFWAQVYADFTAAFANPDLPNAGTVFDPFTKVTCAPTTTQLPLRVEQDGLKSESDACGPSCALGAVQLSNGQLILESSDLRIPGRGPAFEFHRAYRSQYACNGPLGNNWDFVYNMRLMAELDGGGAPTGNLILLDGLGRRDRFDLQGNGTYTSPPGHYRRLTRNADMTYTLLESNGTRELFSVLFPLANYRAFLGAIVDRNGNAVTLSYDPVNGRLNAVIDTLGRRILFVYNALGRLDHVTDFSGRSVAFLYDANGDLIAVTSPAVPAGSTPTGNDFPLGKTTRYAYSAGLASAAANHNMISVTRPNEAALVPQGPPALVNVYGTDPNVALEFDRVLRQSPGGTNAAAAARGLLPAGGNITYFYETLNPGADPNNLTVPRSRATVVNRDGDVSTFEQNVLGGNVAVRAYTGRVDAALPRSALQSLIPSTNPGFPPISRLRPSDPAFFLTSLAYNRDGEITLATRPEGNTKLSVFDAVNTDRLQQGNVLQVVKSPDAGRGGDQSMLVTAFSYEPIYNQLRTMCDARGTDPGFTPPVDPGVTGCARYTTRQTFDYEEGCDAAAVGARVGRSAAEVLTLWSAAGICATPAGDRNGDGLTNQTAGNVVRRDFPTVDLVAGSSEAIAEGDPMQEIVETLAYNGFGQPV
ncbi:MAG TPA: RHS repeat domain-containing protein, partial [Verrucomicrobiae bacterium]|nr:RHS repeat domain-containing protein [Verrucomicrobiae bacterium]